MLIGAFLLFWLIGVLSEIQRSETIDIGKMLHLPVSLKGIFLVNYLASHLTFSIIVFVPGMVGLTAGFIWSRGWMMLDAAPGARLSLLGHGVDLLAARLAGGAAGAKSPPVSGHCGRRHDGLHAAVAASESADERPLRTSSPVLRTYRASDGPRITDGESRRVRHPAGGPAAAQGDPAPVGRQWRDVLGDGQSLAGASGNRGGFCPRRPGPRGRLSLHPPLLRGPGRRRTDETKTPQQGACRAPFHRRHRVAGTELARHSRRGGGLGPGHVSLSHAGDGSEDGARLDHTHGPAVRRDDVLFHRAGSDRRDPVALCHRGSRCCPFSA